MVGLEVSLQPWPLAALGDPHTQFFEPYINEEFERSTMGQMSFGGIGARMPVYAGMMMMACFGSLGLPGLAGFVSEFMVFVGAFGTYPVMTALSVLGVVITAAFFLMMIQRVFLGELNLQWQALKDMDRGELAATIPLAVIMLVVGIYPAPVVAVINTSMAALVNSLQQTMDLVMNSGLPLG